MISGVLNRPLRCSSGGSFNRTCICREWYLGGRYFGRSGPFGVGIWLDALSRAGRCHEDIYLTLRAARQFILQSAVVTRSCCLASAAMRLAQRVRATSVMHSVIPISWLVTPLILREKFPHRNRTIFRSSLELPTAFAAVRTPWQYRKSTAKVVWTNGTSLLKRKVCNIPKFQ